MGDAYNPKQVMVRFHNACAKQLVHYFNNDQWDVAFDYLDELKGSTGAMVMCLALLDPALNVSAGRIEFNLNLYRE
jgi:hypothetical protein